MTAGHGFSLATFNIHHGTDESGRPSLDGQADLLREMNADIVALQECDVMVARSGFVDQVARLAALALYPYHAFGSNVDLEGGKYGCAILSRFSLEGVTNTPVPPSDMRAARVHIDGRTHRHEQRGVLEATIALPDGPVTIFVTHASLWSEERVLGSKLILSRLTDIFTPAVVAGDFNVGDQDAPEIAMLRAAMFDAHVETGSSGDTYPSSAPRWRIDYVLARGMRAIDASVVPTQTSDHFALLAKFELPFKITPPPS